MKEITKKLRGNYMAFKYGYLCANAWLNRAKQQTDISRRNNYLGYASEDIETIANKLNEIRVFEETLQQTGMLNTDQRKYECFRDQLEDIRKKYKNIATPNIHLVTARINNEYITDELKETPKTGESSIHLVK